MSVELHKRSVRFGAEGETICRKGRDRPGRNDGRGAPLHRSNVGRAEIGAWSKRSDEKRGYLSPKLDDPSFNVAPFATLLDR
ncbi:DUF736 family protein [Bradyrhizobium sp. 166]|nr:DUF736 family protein [Bradyrhizobium sp. 166]